jgi:hypothetical protein
MSNSSLNATKHGCCAVDARLLPGESEKEFRNLERMWNEAYNPKTDYHRKLVAECVNADWLLQRATRLCLDIESKLYAKSTNPLDWSEDEQRTLTRLQRYKTANANTVLRCRKAVEDYRKYRFMELTQSQTIEINNERLKTAQRKNQAPTKPAEPTWKEKMQEMRNQAIALGYTPPDMAPDPTKR